MKILERGSFAVCTLMLLCLASGAVVWAAPPSPVYDQVMEALSQLPRDGGITVDFGVEEGRYTEQFALTDATLRLLREAQAPQAVIDDLAAIKNQVFTSKETFMQTLEQTIGQEQAMRYEELILNSTYDGSAAFAIGDSFEARFRADTDCYVALIHIGVETKDPATGKTIGGGIVVLLPNQRTPDARLKAGKVYSTDQNFSIHLTAGTPPGYEVINILCSTEPFDVFDATGVFQNGYAVITPDNEAALQYLLHGVQQAASGKFGGTSLELRIGGTNRAFQKKFGMLKPMGGTGTTGKFFPPLETP